jgi:predicted Ser/Thr protein kinase
VPLRPGEVIAGYTIESVIAHGGMGVVYRARHGELGRLVALKVIAAERTDDPVFRERFVREARLAASLDHPNVIPIFEAGDDGGVLFIAMRLVAGGDLAQLIAQAGRLEPELAVGLIEQAAAGLDAAHARGLIHRDVKPANLLLAADRHVYVSDFGAAKATDAQRPTTDPSEWIGTAGYAAPEQMRGEKLDGRADVFALGCVLAEALPGDLPRALASVVGRARSERAGDRYESAGAFAAAARAALADGCEPTAPTRVNRRRRRPPLEWVIGGLIAAVVGAVAAVALLAGGGGGHAAPAVRPAAPPSLPAASGSGDAVVCRVAGCTQSGQAVAVPIEGGSCARGTWTRIDDGAPEPTLICLPPANPPAGTSSPPLPTLAGARLDRAQTALDRLGIGHDTSGGGLLGILDASNWTVCATSPAAGTLVAAGAKARLFVARSC